MGDVDVGSRFAIAFVAHRSEYRQGGADKKLPLPAIDVSTQRCRKTYGDSTKAFLQLPINFVPLLRFLGIEL